MERTPTKSLDPTSERDDELGGLETVLAMAAVEPEFGRALEMRRDEALAASGVVVSDHEKRILEATSGESLRRMSVSLGRRIPAASRRTFLRRAGQSLALLAGGTLLARESEAAPGAAPAPELVPEAVAVPEAGASVAGETSATRVWWEESKPRVGLSGATGTGSRPSRRRPGKSRRGRVWLRSVKTAGPLSRGIVRRVVNRHLARILYYYRVALIKRKKLKGELKVKFVITPAGKVRFVKLVSSTLRAPALEKSILRAIRVWRFPMPGRVASTTVTAKFRFRPTR